MAARLSERFLDRVFLALLCAALLAPLAVTEYGAPPLHLGLPTIFGSSVDEEGYLVLINSLVRDHDFDLKNNHARVAAGIPEAGRKAAGRIVDHHSTYWIDGKRYVWRDLVDRDTRKWTVGEEGLRYPVFRAGVDPQVAAGPERPAHPVGSALLLYPLLVPFRGSPAWIEHASLFGAGLATVLAVFLLRALLFRFSDSSWTRNLVLLAAFLGTPIWFYARTLYTEPFLVPLILGAVLLALRTSPAALLGAGACVGAAVLMKPNALFLLPVLWAPALLSREPRRILRDGLLLGALPFLAGVLSLWMNARFYGSPLQWPQPYAWGNPLVALKAYLFARDRGLLWFCPPLLLAPFGFRALWRRDRTATLVVVGAFALLFGQMLTWADYNGGWCFGPRLIVPTLPLLVVGLAGILDAPAFQSRFLSRWLFANALVYAVAMNAMAVFRYWITMTWTEAWKIFLDLLAVVRM